MAGTATLDQLRGAPAGASWWQNPALNRLARHPAIRVALIAAQSDADMREMVINPGLQAANGLLAHPAARHIMTQTDLLYGQATYDGALDVGLGEALRQRRHLASDLMADSAYGISLQPDEVYPALSDVLSTAAGRPINAGDLTPDEALDILEGYQAHLDDEVTPAAVSGVTPGNVSIVANQSTEEIDCFEVPPGADRAEFEKQLKEQQDEINDTNIETLQRRRADFINGDARRDTGAQREARRKWIDLRAQDLRAEGLGRADALSTARREAGLMDATHVLDMVAGGDPSRISGLGDSGINRSIGAQWRGRRADQLDAALEEQRRQGRQKPDITLEVC